MELEELVKKWEEDHEWKNRTATRIAQIETSIDMLIKKTEKNEKAIVSMVTWKSFTLILSITMTVVAGMFYLVWDRLGNSEIRLEKTAQNTFEISRIVSRLEGILTNAEIE